MCVCQFSSIGKMGKAGRTSGGWLGGEFFHSLWAKPVQCRSSTQASALKAALTTAAAHQPAAAATTTTTTLPSRAHPRAPHTPEAASAQRLSFCYPTVEDVRTSYEGYAGGGALPHASK